MRIRRSQDSLWRASTLRLADKLIADLLAVCQRAAARGDPGLVDLNRALKHARKLRSNLRRKSQNARRWQTAFEAVAYVAAVARKVYSLLNNCISGWVDIWPLVRSYACCALQKGFPKPSWPRSSALHGLTCLKSRMAGNNLEIGRASCRERV